VSYRAVPTGLVCLERRLPGTAVPGFHVSCLTALLPQRGEGADLPSGVIWGRGIAVIRAWNRSNLGARNRCKVQALTERVSVWLSRGKRAVKTSKDL
jgi:hypothetical protein